MSASPKDFFLGISEFFSLLLPGAILLGLFTQEVQQIASVIDIPTHGAAAWVAFAVASYVAGHVLHAVGSWLDKQYDRWYANPRRTRPGEGQLLGLATELHDRMLGAQKDAVNVFSWSGSFVRAMSPAAASEIEARSSESKFFRSLIPVLVIALILLWWRMQTTGVNNPLVIAFALDLLLILFAWWRYCIRRWDSVQLTYEYYVLLAMLNEKALIARPGDAANDSAST